MKLKCRFNFAGFIVLLLLGLCRESQAQTTITTNYTTGTITNLAGNSGMVFAIDNTNGNAVILNAIGHYINANNTANWSLWYHPTASLTGVPSSITTANGWIELVVPTSVTNPGAAGIQPIFSNLNFTIPANTGYRFAIVSSNTYYYNGAGSAPNLFQDNGVQLYVGDNPNSPGYTGAFPSLITNTPRFFTGFINFTLPPSLPNDAGISLLTTPGGAFCPSQQDIKVMVRNYGTNVINNMMVGWQKDGVNQPPVSVTTPLAVFGGTSIYETEVTLGSHTFTGAMTVKAWTYSPNSTNDIVNTNDTLQATLTPSLQGAVTINAAQPTGGSNYQSFLDFTNALNTFGVCGPLTATVAAGSGPYNETVSFGNITGSSATNTIRVNGNGATVQFANTTSDRQMLKLQGSKYITINNLNFVGTATTFGWGAVINGGAQYDSLINCTFNLSAVTTTTAANSAGICFSGSLTATTTAGDAKHCYIGGNTIIGNSGAGSVYYGITLPSGADSNTIVNNTISNFYMYGIWLSGSTMNHVANNELHRATKTAVTTHYGIYGTGNISGSVINANRIHSPGGAATAVTSAAYGLYFTSATSTASLPSIVSNNLFYKVNQGGVIYGIYLSGTTNMKVYHNTITLDQMLTGTSVNAGIYCTGTNTNSELKNNLVNITGGSLGIKYGVYYANAASIANAQRNNIYVNSTQTGLQHYAALPAATTYPDLASFQTTNPTLEIGSLSVNPQFTNAGLGNFLPTNSLLGSNGETLLSLVPADILGNNRSGLPTPGAYEMPVVPGNDAGIVSLISPTQNYCANQQSVQVSIINGGTSQLSGIQIHWQLNGINQSPFQYVGILDTIGGTGQYLDTVTLGSVTIPAGNNTIKAWTIVTTDINLLNDTLTVSTSPTAFTLASGSDTICLGADATINLQPSTGYSTGMIQWQSSPDASIFANIINANAPTYVAISPASSHSYRAFINSGNGGCYSDTFSVFVSNPTITANTPGARCGQGSVQLGATGSAGSSINWFDVATGGTSLGTGNTFNTPSISSTATYYAEPSTGGGVTSIGAPNNGAASGYTLEAGLFFDVLASSITIQGVYVYPVGTGAGTVVIALKDASANDILTYTANLTGTAAPGIQTFVPLNFTVPTGTGYSLVMKERTGGVANLIRDGLNDITGGGFPFTLPGIMSITTGRCCPIATSTSYYYFYNWQISSGCKGARVPVVATVNIGPSAIGTGSSRCGTGTVTLSATSTAPGGIFNWYIAPTGGSSIGTGASFTTPSISNTTTYYVSVSNNGCEGDRVPVVATVNIQPVVTGTGASICEEGAVTLSATSTAVGATFNWYAAAIGGTALSTGATYTTPTLLGTTTYYVAATDNGCEGTREPVIATINDNPIATIGNDTAFCTGSSIMLSATSTVTGTWEWDDASTNATRTINTAGTYFASITDANSCTGTDTIVVTENALPVVNLGSDTSICDADVLTLDAGNAGSEYLWDNSSTLQIRDISTLGDYYVAVTDNNGCVGTDTLTVMQIPAPSASINAVNTTPGNYNFTANNVQGDVLGYYWNFGDGTANATINPTQHSYAANGTYVITLTLYGKCDTVVITQNLNVSGITSINKVELNNSQLSVYPNPAKDLLTVACEEGIKMSNIRVFNIVGQLVYDAITTNSNIHLMNISNFVSGIYTINITTDKGTVIRKFEVLK